MCDSDKQSLPSVRDVVVLPSGISWPHPHSTARGQCRWVGGVADRALPTSEGEWALLVDEAGVVWQCSWTQVQAHAAA